MSVLVSVFIFFLDRFRIGFGFLFRVSDDQNEKARPASPSGKRKTPAGPVEVGYRVVRRVQAKSSPERLRRRLKNSEFMERSG